MESQLLFPFKYETITFLNASFGMKQPEKPKRKRIAVKVPPLNDGTNTPVPVLMPLKYKRIVSRTYINRLKTRLVIRIKFNFSVPI
jgi:hypothetical protein